MGLTFQVPTQYCSLQHQTLLLSPLTSTIVLFLLWLHPFILSGVISPLISSSILGTCQPGEFLFQYPIILHFHTVNGVLKARILKWFSIPFSSGPHSVRTLHHDPFFLGGPTQHGLVSASPWHYPNKLITPSCGNQESSHSSSLIVHSVADYRLLRSCMVHSVLLS